MKSMQDERISLLWRGERICAKNTFGACPPHALDSSDSVFGDTIHSPAAASFRFDPGGYGDWQYIPGELSAPSCRIDLWQNSIALAHPAAFIYYVCILHSVWSDPYGLGMGAQMDRRLGSRTASCIVTLKVHLANGIVDFACKSKTACCQPKRALRSLMRSALFLYIKNSYK